MSESLCDESTKPSTWENCVTECPQDCAVSSWGEWDLNCSHTCGDTLKTRQRVILQQPQGLGRSCPSLVDKQICRETACTSFKWKVGIWNTCKLGSQGGICGNGTQTREVTCSPDPAREWICQKQAPKPVESQDCALACPGINSLVNSLAQPETHKLHKSVAGLLPCSHQADIRMRSHRLLRLDDNKSAASCQQA